MFKRLLWVVFEAIITASLLEIFVTFTVQELKESESQELQNQIGELSLSSLELVDQAILVLEQDWDNMNPRQKETFLRIFDPGLTGEVDQGFVDQVLENYKKIRQTLDEGLRINYAQNSIKCEAQRLFFTDLVKLNVCPYFYEEANELRKTRNLIHETAHIALVVADRHYYRPNSKQYATLTPTGSSLAKLPIVGRTLREVLRGDTLFHPDAYAHFALQNAGHMNIYDVAHSPVVKN